MRRFRPTIVACVMLVCLLAAAPQSTPQVEAGQKAFAACSGCHGLDGRGGEHASNIASAAKVQQMSDAKLAEIIRNGIPGTGMPGFRGLLKDEQISSITAYLRVLQGGQSAVPVPGDPGRGRELFFGRAGCGECHIVEGKGGFLGGDLSGYGRNHSAATIKEAILLPEKFRDPRRGTVTVVGSDGKQYRGAVRNEDNFSLQMQTPDGTFHLFEKASAREIKHDPVSLMPADYGKRLSKSDLDDLISFVLRSAQNDPAKNEDPE